MSHTSSSWCLVDNHGRVFRLPQTMIFLGREDCDINLSSRSVDGKHAVLTFDHYEDQFKMKDLSSLNGTYVNEARISSDAYVYLKEKDSIRFGYDPHVYRLERVPAKADKVPAWARKEPVQLAECTGCSEEEQSQHSREERKAPANVTPLYGQPAWWGNEEDDQYSYPHTATLTNKDDESVFSADSLLPEREHRRSEAFTVELGERRAQQLAEKSGQLTSGKELLLEKMLGEHQLYPEARDADDASESGTYTVEESGEWQQAREDIDRVFGVGRPEPEGEKDDESEKRSVAPLSLDDTPRDMATTVRSVVSDLVSSPARTGRLSETDSEDSDRTPVARRSNSLRESTVSSLGAEIARRAYNNRPPKAGAKVVANKTTLLRAESARQRRDAEQRRLGPRSQPSSRASSPALSTSSLKERSVSAARVPLLRPTEPLPYDRVLLLNIAHLAQRLRVAAHSIAIKSHATSNNLVGRRNPLQAAPGSVQELQEILHDLRETEALLEVLDQRLWRDNAFRPLVESLPNQQFL